MDAETNFVIKSFWVSKIKYSFIIPGVFFDGIGWINNCNLSSTCFLILKFSLDISDPNNL